MDDLTSRSICLSGRYSWDDFDRDAKEMDMNRSQFFQFLYNYWKKSSKKNVLLNRVIDLFVLLMLVIIIVLIISLGVL